MFVKARVLIVDDQYELRESLWLILKDKYSVAIAVAAEEAFKCMDEYSFNLVLLDFKMPNMDGITALKEIKKRYPGTEVIMMTGYAPADTKQNALSLGAFAFFMKPFDINEFICTIDEAIQKSIAKKS
jgi:DNA-binding NtrC family response regulator